MKILDLAPWEIGFWRLGSQDSCFSPAPTLSIHAKPALFSGMDFHQKWAKTKGSHDQIQIQIDKYKCNMFIWMIIFKRLVQHMIICKRLVHLDDHFQEASPSRWSFAGGRSIQLQGAGWSGWSFSRGWLFRLIICHCLLLVLAQVPGGPSSGWPKFPGCPSSRWPKFPVAQVHGGPKCRGPSSQGHRPGLLIGFCRWVRGGSLKGILWQLNFSFTLIN